MSVVDQAAETASGRLPAELQAWVEREMGRRITAWSRPATGGSRTTWLIDLDGDASPRSVVLRVEGEGSFTGTELTLQRETIAYRALGTTAVPVPHVYAVRGDGTAVILERLRGSDDLSALDARERSAVLDDFAAVLAELHRADTTLLELPGFDRPATAEEHARLDVAMWQRLAAGIADLDPLIAYCGAWLVAHAPTEVARTAFIQGDTGPGNFMAADGRVSGLVDMEFAHLGDPMDDIAWVTMRLQDAGTPEEFVAAYLRHGGVPIDQASVAFYRLAVDYRCAITTSLAVDRGGGARGWAPYLLQTQRYLDGIAARLAVASGCDPGPIESPDRASTPRTSMFDQLQATLRAAAGEIGGSDRGTVTRNDQILVHYLRAYDQIGAQLEEADRLERIESCGAELDPTSLTAAASDAGARGDELVLGYLLRRQRRQRLLWSTLLDR